MITKETTYTITLSEDELVLLIESGMSLMTEGYDLSDEALDFIVDFTGELVENYLDVE